MGERTEPIKHLNDQGKDEPGKMEDLYNPILGSPKGTQKEKDNPEKMDQNHSIRKNLVKHLLNEPQISEPIAYHIIKFFPRKRLAVEGIAANLTWADKKGSHRGRQAISRLRGEGDEGASSWLSGKRDAYTDMNDAYGMLECMA
jgi:hypothetical protein